MNIQLEQFFTDCFYGNLRSLKKIVDSGFDVDVEYPGRGNTGLRIAVCANRYSIVNYLLSNGADPNKKIWSKSKTTGNFNINGGTAIFEAKNVKMVNLLLKHGANLHVVDDDMVSLKANWERDEITSPLALKFFKVGQ